MRVHLPPPHSCRGCWGGSAPAPAPACTCSPPPRRRPAPRAGSGPDCTAGAIRLHFTYRISVCFTCMLYTYGATRLHQIAFLSRSIDYLNYFYFLPRGLTVVFDRLSLTQPWLLFKLLPALVGLQVTSLAPVLDCFSLTQLYPPLLPAARSPASSRLALCSGF